MIIAIARFRLPDGMTDEDAAKMFEASVPRYEALPGLVRKNYILGGGYGGGVYLWESLEAAKALYEGDMWRSSIRERFGSDPELAYYDNPVTIDKSA